MVSPSFHQDLAMACLDDQALENQDPVVEQKKKKRKRGES